MRTHEMLDRCSLALHRLIAARLLAEPTLLERARAALARWRRTASPNSLPYLDAWERLVDAGLEPCLSVLVDESDRATALRQAAPFAGILSNAERAEFFKMWAKRPTEAT